jgi:hypothetical protein
VVREEGCKVSCDGDGDCISGEVRHSTDTEREKGRERPRGTATGWLCCRQERASRPCSARTIPIPTAMAMACVHLSACHEVCAMGSKSAYDTDHGLRIL